MLGSFQLNFWGPPYACNIYMIAHYSDSKNSVKCYTNIYSHFLSQKPHSTLSDFYKINNGDYENEIIFLVALLKPNYHFT